MSNRKTLTTIAAIVLAAALNGCASHPMMNVGAQHDADLQAARHVVMADESVSPGAMGGAMVGASGGAMIVAMPVALAAMPVHRGPFFLGAGDAMGELLFARYVALLDQRELLPAPRDAQRLAAAP